MPTSARSSTTRPSSPPTIWSPIRRSFGPTWRVDDLNIRSTSTRTPMPIPVLMPALSPTMEKGNLAKWVKQQGDKVKSGDIIAEIETDKATMEVEATDEGTLGQILVPEGTADVAVNTPIAVILSEGEDKVALNNFHAEAPAQQEKGSESAPPAAPEAPAAQQARAPAKPASAVAA